MAKNATYMFHFTVNEMVKVISNYTENKFLRDLLTASDFLLLTDKSTNEAGRAQLLIFVRYVNSFTNEPKEEFVCIRKLGTSKTSKALMNELELIQFSGLDGTNMMSGEKKCLQHHIRHVSP